MQISTENDKIIQKGCDFVNYKDLEKEIISNLSAISHELQTPISMISATAKLSGAKIEKGDEDLSSLKQYMDNIVNNCNKMSMLISNITDLNSITTSHKEYVNTKQFFDTFCKTVEPLCNDANVKLICDFNADDKRIYISVLTLERILLNLITNAIKYNDKNKKTITIKMSNDENCIILSVKDNGIGISKENIEKVTKQFFRVDKNQAPGIGLGLTLVENYLKYMNGTMTIKSQLKKGTEITISIPFTSDENIFTANESDYIYIPEKNTFNIEFAQLKMHSDI